MLETQVLEVTFSGLVANRAIEGMINEKEFNDGFPGFQYLG